MKYSFANAKAPSAHKTQYFEMFANRAIHHDGWVACTTPVGAPWDPNSPTADVIDGYKWELYAPTDFSQAENLASKMPDKLKDLQLLFYTEAARYNVLPLDNSRVARIDPAIRPSLTRGRKSFTYYEGQSRIPESAAPDIKNKSWSITAEVEVKADATGMIVTHGGLFAGYALYLDKGKPVFHYNFVDVAHYEVVAKDAVAPGKHTIKMHFAYDGKGLGKGGTTTITVDGTKVATGRVERTIPSRITLDEGFDVGEDTGTPVNLKYDVPFTFSGTIGEVTIDLK